jgi:CBS domain-containing protein
MVPVSALGTVSADHDAWETLVRMSDQNLEWLAVVDDGEFRGVVSPRRLLDFARRRRPAPA